MKLTRKSKTRSIPKAPKSPSPWIVLDERDLFFARSDEDRKAFASMVQSQRKLGARSMIATQAIIKTNSGKRVRLIGSARWSDGAPAKAAPKKFVPSQVARQQASK